MSLGSTGPDVVALQKKLGVDPATGYYGKLTQAAVMAYQTVMGIPINGRVDSFTRNKLNQ
jgi:peptidoglycan hydrolase-like protein with peptidoglycan-binding domain